ncbi:PAS domain S-box protein, partial [bacterium]
IFVLIQFYAFKIGPNRYLSINNLIEDSISAKELLIRHKEELSKIFDLLPLYIYTVDRNSTIKFVNKKFQAEFGLPLKDIIGKTAYDFYPVEHASKYLRDDQRVIRTQKVFQAVEENVHPQTGITHHVHVTKLPIYNEKAEVTGVLGVFYDMTSEYMLQMTKDAQLKEKDLLLREAHHRIKNNLNMIIGMMSLDASAITNESAKIALNAAIVKMKSMMGIYNQLYVEIDQKKLVQMQSFLTDLFEDFKEHLVPPEITLHLQVKKLLLDDRFASMVGIILTELITNSIKYAFPLGFGKIEASVLKRNNCLVIKVADDGRGLPEDVRINHMYGFGLSMIQQLIETVNGKIVFDSKHKSTIEIHLPNTSLEKPELISE